MAGRQFSHSRMTTQTRRREPPSPLPRLRALAAAERGPLLGLCRPRKHANYRPAIYRAGALASSTIFSGRMTSAKWQATGWPAPPRGMSGGSSCAQIS